MKNIELKQVMLPNNETYQYRQYIGGEKTIILVHGNLASSIFFENLINLLPQEFTVYAIDLRGFGGSTYLNPINSITDYAEDLKMFVDKLELINFDLLGWSTGGAICMYFTSKYGYLINRLFLLSSVGIAGYPSYSIEPDGSKKILKTRQEIQEDKNKRQLFLAYKNKDKNYYKYLWDNIIYNINKPEADVYLEQIEESMLQQNHLDIYYNLSNFNISDYHNEFTMGSGEVKKINNPTIIFHGEDDLIVPVKDAKEIKEFIGENAQLVLIENCGHAPLIDNPMLVVKYIVES